MPSTQRWTSPNVADRTTSSSSCAATSPTSAAQWDDALPAVRRRRAASRRPTTARGPQAGRPAVPARAPRRGRRGVRRRHPRRHAIRAEEARLLALALGDQLGARRRRRVRALRRTGARPRAGAAATTAPSPRRTRPGRCSPPCAATCPANARFYDIALDHAERAGDVAQIVRIRTNRGSRLTEQGQYAQAVAELDLAITTAELAGSDTFSALAYNNRGEAYLALGQLDLALADLRRAHDIWTRLASNRILYPLNNMGFVQLLRGQRSEAIALFNEAIRIAAEQRDAQGLVPAYVGLANALDRDDPAGAAEAARQAIEANHAMWMAARLHRRRQRRPATPATSTPPPSGRQRRPSSPGSATTARRSPRRCCSAPTSARVIRRRSPSRRAGCGTTSATRSARLAPTWRSPARPPAGGAKNSSPAPNECCRTPGRGASSPTPAASSARVSTSSVVIATLGGFRVSRDGEPVDVGEWGSRKARDLVKLLVARRGRTGRARRSHRTAVAGRTGPLGTAPVGAVEHRAHRVRPAQAAESRLLRRRRPRHRVART